MINFTGDLYDQELELELFSKIREMQKFDSVEELKIALDRDVKEVLELVKNHP